MKNISLVLLLASLFLPFHLEGQITTFYKLYGNADDNYPQKVKGFSSFTYVLATRYDGMADFATFSKFTSTGSLIWEKQLDFPSKLVDFEYTGATDNSFLLVGRTEPLLVGGVWQDNQSLLVKIDNSGNLVFAEKYFHTGRESFTRIIRHTNALPTGTPFEFYVVGTKNSTLPASSDDQLMLYNFDNAGTARFAKEYFHSVELEASLGIFQRASNGNVVVLGIDYPTLNGIAIEMDGVTGADVAGYSYNNANNTGQYAFWDGVELPNNQLVIAGDDRVAGKGILLTLNSTLLPLFGSVFDNVSEFHEIGRDALGNANFENLYLIGPAKQTPDYPVVTQVSTNFSAFTLLSSAYYENGETDFKNPHFSVTPASPIIYYADSRLVAPVNYDMLVGAFDLNFYIQNPANNCRDTFLHTTTSFLPVRTAFSVYDTNTVQSIIPVGNLMALAMPCDTFCPPVDTCGAYFTWQSNGCLTIQFTGTGTSSGSGPITYSWTTNGNPATSSLQNPLVSYSASGTYNVCLTITDVSTNCTATVCQNVVVPAAALPTCTVPGNLTVATTQGQCTAFVSTVVSGTGCPTVSITATLSGVTTGTFTGGSPLTVAGIFNKGLTTITVVVTDGLNQTVTCSYTVTVVDVEPPVIICPQNISVNVPACDGGGIVYYPAPTVTDNCPMVSYVCSHPSGFFFPCGTTTVTCTATDMSQNISSCTFTVNVNCQCASIGTTTIACDPVTDDKYLFTIPVFILNGSTNCTASVAGTGQSNVTVMSNPISITSGFGTLTGMITVTGGVIPPTFTLVVSINCTCPGGGVSNCTYPVSLVPICCKHIYLNDHSVCATDQTFSMPIVGCGQFTCITRLDYYVATGPTCPPFPGTGWSLQQSGTACSPMLLLPYLYTDNIWVKAILTVCDFPCTVVESNIACITLCQPVSCNITSSASQEFCYTGSPITPNLMTVNYSNGTGCPPASITWTGPPGTATGNTFQPNPVSATSAPTPCYEDFIYTAHVQTICGTQTCSETVRLFKDNADIGDLVMNPVEPQPFCPGEDATLEFMDECTSLPPAPGMWTWCVSTTSAIAGFSPITGSGNMNPLWNTNQLYQDHWYKVKASNGVCSQKEEVFFIDVRDIFTIGTFSATCVAPTPGCIPTGVNLSVSFSPSPIDPGCQLKVTWIKNGQVLHVDFYTSSPATWFYSNPGDCSGNYWCIVERLCPGCNKAIKSNLVTLDPPCFATMTAPCFRCNNQAITLCGVMHNVPAGVTCTYQWFKNGLPIPGETGLCITVYQANATYTFQANCNGCMKSVSYFLKQCGSGPYLFTFYRDFDADSFGDIDSTLADDELPPGYVTDSTDCDDTNPSIYPGAPELCNGNDDDCNGNPESQTQTWTGSGDDLNWSDAANWSDGFLPLTCQDVVIPTGKIVKVAAGYHAVGKTLTVPQTAQLTVETTGTLTIQN